MALMTPTTPTTPTAPTAHPGNPHVLLAGGGSGGHVFPGLAVADALVERGFGVSWAGAAGGIEERLVGAREIAFHALPARPVVGRSLLGKAGALFTLAFSALRARSLVRRLDARVVVGTGGYVSAPAVVGAKLASRPVVLIEPNADAGTANRALSRWAVEAMVAHPETAEQLRCPTRVTGVPVRAELIDAQSPLPEGPPWRVLVLGGSQGAKQLNEILPRALARLADEFDGLEVLHQAGTRHLQATRAAYGQAAARRAAAGKLSRLDAQVTPFIDDMAAAMARSHLLISRAGAITLAEICAVGRPSLLIPLDLAGGHQISNARRLADAGAAEMLFGDEVEPERLTAVLRALLGDLGRLRGMAEAARRLSCPDAAQSDAVQPDAARAIAERIAEIGGRNP